MKRFKNIPENTLRFMILIAAMYTLGLNMVAFYNNMIANRMTWVENKNPATGDSLLMITEIIPGGVADEAGIKDGDLLLEIQGKPVTMKNAMAILNSYSNEFIEYTVLRGGKVLSVNIWVYKFLSLPFLIFWIIGIGFFIVGIIVGYSKPKEFTSKLFFLLSMSASLGLLMYSSTSPTGIVTTPYMDTFTRFVFTFIIVNFLLAMFLFAPLFVHFFLTFPVKKVFKRRKLVLTLLYLICFIPGIVSLITSGRISLGFIGGVLPVILYLATGIALFRHSYSKITDSGLKKSLSIINKGFVLGALGLTYYAVYILAVKTPVFLVNPLYYAPVILVVAIPISFGFSIFKYRILDTEVIVKRGLVFGIVTVLIIGIYLAVVYLIDSYFKGFFKGNNQLLIITFIIIFTFSFDYVNKHAREFVDSQIYRERYNYRKLLLKFSEEISYVKNPQDLVRRIQDFLEDTLGINYFTLDIMNDRYPEKVLRLQTEDDGVKIQKANEVLRKILKLRNEPVQINAVSLSEAGLTDEESYTLRKTGVKLTIPVFVRNEVVAALNFGAKASGKAFSDEDIDLLKTFASQSSICLENTRLRAEEMNKQMFEEELRIAKNIQTGLLPKDNFSTTHLEIAAYSEPARIIGGDFYDLIPQENGKLLLTVADVSDKGIPAALYMSQVQAMIQFAAKVIKSPKDILIEINKQIYDSLDKFSFVTIIIGQFDEVSSRLRIARAGHTPVLRVRGGKAGLIQSHGIGVGLDPDKIFEHNIEEIEVETSIGDIYLFYSDGLSEAMNRKRELMGTERISAAMISAVESSPDISAEEIKQSILKSADDFRGGMEPNDDVTFVVVKVK
ncbi:MAG: SpoIIE family protein phosphatase [Ignavibacteriae bacterium]|nr:SpoIIE family protein phosphatase [Ignavibacteriota bacterium]